MRLGKSLKTLVKSLSKVKLKAAKHAPEIFMAAGIVGTCAATVMACKASKNVDDIVEEHKEEVEEIKAEASETPMNEHRKKLFKAYAKFLGKLIKNYGKAAAVLIISIGAILYGHNMLRHWYVDMSAIAASALQDNKKIYAALEQEVGKEKAMEILNDIHHERVEETVVDAKGKEKILKKDRATVGPNMSQFTIRYNQQTADTWVADWDRNEYTILREYEFLVNQFETKETGHMYWIDAVEYMLGNRGLKMVLDERKRKKLPNIVQMGWIYNPEMTNQFQFKYMRDPENDYGFLLTFIPEGNITELI